MVGIFSIMVITDNGILSYYLLLPIFTGITSITVISSGNNMLIWENVGLNFLPEIINFLPRFFVSIIRIVLITIRSRI